MQFIFFPLVTMLIRYARKKTNDFFNPLFVSAAMWGGFTLAYELLCLGSDNYRRLSVHYYLAVIIYLLSFSLICYFFMRGIKRRDNYQVFETDSISFSSRVLDTLVTLAIIANVFYIVTLFALAGTMNVGQAIANIRIIARSSNTNITSVIRIPSFLFNFTPLLLCYIAMYKVKAKRWKVVLLLGEMMIISMLLATKGRLVRFLVLIAIFLWRLLPRKKFRLTLIVLIPIGIALLYFMTMSRDTIYFETYNLGDYVFLYLLSPIPALDRLLCGELSFSSTGFAVRTFDFFYTVLYRVFGVSKPQYIDPGYFFVPTSNGRITTNVATVIGSYYMDFGIIGFVICAMIYGLMFGFAYRKMIKEKRSEYAVFFILNVPYLMFQTFGDFIIPTLSITIQEFICSVAITYMGKRKRKKF